MIDDELEYEEEMGYEEESSEDEDAEETELQDAFLRGEVKPGLNREIVKKVFVYNEEKLNAALNQLFLDYAWIERLDLNSKPAPMSQELADKLQEEKEKVIKRGGKPDDARLNDFERESMFLCQAQGAAMEGLSKLKALGISTKRPDDYFAQMAKTDAHMQKVRASMLSQQSALQRSEKVRQIRQMRKVNKELQKQARVQKINEKREFLNQVKKYREKMSDNLDFLESKPKPKPKSSVISKGKKPVNKRAEAKRQMKEQRYGMGGRKKGSKQNTKESAAGISDRKKHGRGNMGNIRGKGKKSKSRPGKSKRIKQKAGRKR